jgi:hypothetical protein
LTDVRRLNFGLEEAAGSPTPENGSLIGMIMELVRIDLAAPENAI